MELKFDVLFKQKKRGGAVVKIKSKEMPFVGRAEALAELKRLDESIGASLIVIRGRRRIGKSRLVEKYAEHKAFIKFSGLAPEEGVTAKHQRENFAYQFQEQFHSHLPSSDDWNHLFSALANQINDQPLVLLFDEITWMADNDPTFLPKLKNFWDDHAKQNPNLLFVLCSSISSWVDENILASKAFYGRVRGQITLEELSLSESKELLTQLNIRCSSLETFYILSITGGVPWYMELFSHQQSVLENIKRLCFEKEGPLTREFSRIFGDLFGRRETIYQHIVFALSEQRLSQSLLATKLNYSNSKRLGVYLNDLKTAGFLKKDVTWSVKTGKTSKIAQWRLSDNYLRFYLKYIQPNMDKIENNRGASIYDSLNNFSGIMGLQFENLVLNNTPLLINALGIHESEIVFDNTYFQKKTATLTGCQIDYMIQTKLNTLFVFEIKFSKRAISSSVIQEVQEKIKRIKKPKSFTCVPVLVHANGITEELEDNGFFYRIINFSDYL